MTLRDGSFLYVVSPSLKIDKNTQVRKITKQENKKKYKKD